VEWGVADTTAQVTANGADQTWPTSCPECSRKCSSLLVIMARRFTFRDLGPPFDNDCLKLWARLKRSPTATWGHRSRAEAQGHNRILRQARLFSREECPRRYSPREQLEAESDTGHRVRERIQGVAHRILQWDHSRDQTFRDPMCFQHAGHRDGAPTGTHRQVKEMGKITVHVPYGGWRAFTFCSRLLLLKPAI